MISFAPRTRLSNAAADRDFDLELPEEGLKPFLAFMLQIEINVWAG